MSATRDPLAGIDFSRPVRIDPDDISGQEMDDFAAATGGELWPYLTAIRNGEVGEDQMLIGKNRRAMFALVWIFFRRQKPELTFDQVYQRGVGEIGLALESIRQTTSPAPAGANGKPEPVRSGWQSGE